MVVPIPSHVQDSSNVPYNVGVNNTWDVNSTYLSAYDWLYGPYAPSFWADNFDALALSEVITVLQTLNSPFEKLIE